MKRFLLLVILCFASLLAYADSCLPPKKQDIYLDSKKSDQQIIYFGGRYSINISLSTKVIFSNDMLAYIYDKDKHFVIHGDSEASEENKQETLQAFGLSADKSENMLRKSYDICGGTITQFNIKGMTEIVIGIDSTVSGRPNTMVYLFNEVSPYIEQIQFLNFSKEEIKEVLSSLKNTTRK
ncbi:hypothetical protein MTZ49_09365 [Entomomonas sp. E2T0]|uniref:hypothetical protein n=1 Tax=Entomomonas sp. E2T0 TaxID=2930213 RepID=UPI0022284D82|nr:hypothetical protein [Entomomonas sp. E2T0]UYZ82820.1 hypothetical protein MTZ49_09365 [Entomomonas sp. E2T0]